MSRKIIIYDDFYKDPDKIRSIVNQENLSSPLICSDLNDLIVSLIGAYTVPVDNNMHGCFDLSTEENKNEKISFNLNSKWTGIVFLTPDLKNKTNNGVSFWKNKSTNEYTGKKEQQEKSELSATDIISGYIKTPHKNEFKLDKEKWIKDSFVSGKFNRAIFFRSDLYNSVSPGFGKDYNDGKLTQLFFFGDNNESN